MGAGSLLALVAEAGGRAALQALTWTAECPYGAISHPTAACCMFSDTVRYY